MFPICLVAFFCEFMFIVTFFYVGVYLLFINKGYLNHILEIPSPFSIYNLILLRIFVVSIFVVSRTVISEICFRELIWECLWVGSVRATLMWFQRPECDLLSINTNCGDLVSPEAHSSLKAGAGLRQLRCSQPAAFNWVSLQRPWQTVGLFLLVVLLPMKIRIEKSYRCFPYGCY